MGTNSPAYDREYHRRRYAERKAWAVEYCGGECVDCGETEIEKLDFHHVEPDTNYTMPVTQALKRWSIERLRAFIDSEEVELRCIACHKHLHLHA
jgi:hypothetical protein